METNTKSEAALSDSERRELRLFLGATRRLSAQIASAPADADWVGLNILLGKLDSRLWSRGLTNCTKAVEALELVSAEFDKARASGEQLRYERKVFAAERAGRSAQKELSPMQAAYVAEIAAMTRR